MFRLFLLVVALGGGLAMMHERSVKDLKAVCGAFASMEASAPAQIFSRLGGEIDLAEITEIRERCAKTQYHIGMFFAEDTP